MSKTLQYFMFYILSLLVGQGLCVKERPVFLYYENNFYIAWGSLNFSQWSVNGNGRLAASGTEKSVVVLSLCEKLDFLPEQSVSIGDGGNVEMETFNVTKIEGGFICVPLDRPARQTTPTLEDLRNESEDRRSESWVRFQLLEFGRAEGENVINCVISPGLSATSYPDVKLVSRFDGVTMLLGYLVDKNSQFCRVRLLGDYLDEFKKIPEDKSMCGWDVTEVNGDWTFPGLPSFVVSNLWLKDDFIIEIRKDGS